MKEQFSQGESIVDRLQNSRLGLLSDDGFENWLKSNSISKDDWAKYRRIWESTGDAMTLERFRVMEAWEKVDDQIRKRERKITYTKNLMLVFSGVAASVLFFFGLYHFFGYSDLSSAPVANIVVTTTYGSRSEVVLPDGSRVKLNAGSMLKYHYKDKENERKVDFIGEAFFDVAKSKIPFVIHTPDSLSVKVLGTKFNLSTYTDDPFAQTSLFEGKIELSKKGTADLVLLPGDIAVLNKKSNTIEYATGKIEHSTSWMQNKLYMENMSLGDVCKYLERWYDVKILFADDRSGKEIHYTGVLKEQTVLDVLNVLCKLSTIRYELNGKEIKIYRK
jgi:transmembrane sensor